MRKHRDIKLVLTERKKNLFGVRTKFHCTHKKDDIYKDNAEDVETRFDTSNYETYRPLRKGKNKIVIVLMKDELGGKIMKKFVGLREETYSYLINDGSEDKKAKGAKKRKKT